MKFLAKVLALFFSISILHAQDAKPPVNFAIIGLVHDHALGMIPLAKGRTDAQLVGIVEADQELCARYAKRFNLSSNLFYPTLEALLAKTNVQGCRFSRPHLITGVWWNYARRCIFKS